jgi:hypothetical protein
VQSPASDAPKGGNQPGKESASMSVKGTATRYAQGSLSLLFQVMLVRCLRYCATLWYACCSCSRSSTLAAAAKVTRKPEMGGAREPTPVGSAQQQAPQAKQPYLATVLGGTSAIGFGERPCYLHSHGHTCLL